MAIESVYFTIGNFRGRHVTQALKQELDNLYGVAAVSVDAKTHQVGVGYETLAIRQDQVKSKIEEMGFDITRMQF